MAASSASRPRSSVPIPFPTGSLPVPRSGAHRRHAREPWRRRSRGAYRRRLVTASSKRFDINHPETNGTIEYFRAPDGRGAAEIGFEELIEYRKAGGMQFRARLRASTTRLSSGTLDPPSASARAGRWRRDYQVHRHRPAHAGQDAAQQTLQGHGRTGPRDRRRARRAGAAPRRRRGADRRGQPARHPRRSPGGERDQPRARRGEGHQPARCTFCFGNYGGQSIQKGATGRS